MNREPPFEDDLSGDGDHPPYEWLDEWLCEYVDGTMDPSLEAVFEQYVEANPELKAHVERLQETRELLCNCGLPQTPSTDVQRKVCTEVECDMLRSPVPVATVLWDRPLVVLGMVSSVTVALVVGFLVGAAAVDPPPSTSGYPEASVPENGPPVVQYTPPGSRELPPPRRTVTSLSVPDSMENPSTLTAIGFP